MEEPDLYYIETIKWRHKPSQSSLRILACGLYSPYKIWLGLWRHFYSIDQAISLKCLWNENLKKFLIFGMKKQGKLGGLPVTVSWYLI